MKYSSTLFKVLLSIHVPIHWRVERRMLSCMALQWHTSSTICHTYDAVAIIICVCCSCVCMSLCVYVWVRVCEPWVCVHIPSPYLFSFLRQSCFFFFMFFFYAVRMRVVFTLRKPAVDFYRYSFYMFWATQMQRRYRYEVVNHVDMIIAKKKRSMKAKKHTIRVYCVQSAAASMMAKVWYERQTKETKCVR